MDHRNRIGRNDPCHCNSGLKYKNCCRKLDTPVGTRQIRPQQAIDNWEPGKLKRIPNEPRTRPIDDSIQQAVNQRIGHAANEAGLHSRWGSSGVGAFVLRAQQLASVIYERWELSIIDEMSSKLAMQAGQIHPKHICSIYWNEIDQNFFCFRCEILQLISDQVRRSYLQFDDHICVAMQARQMIEATLAACANQFVAFLCFNPLPRMLDSRICGFVEWKNLYEYASLLNGWTPKQRRAMQSYLGSDLTMPDTLLKTDFEPTCQRLFAFTAHFAEHWEDKFRSKQMDGEIKQLQQCYRYLCKFAHVTPQAFRFPEIQSNEPPYHTDVVQSVRVCVLEAQRLCFALLDTLYLQPAFCFLRFQPLVDSRIYTNDTNDMMQIQDSILPAVLSNFHDVIVPAESGDKVVHKVRRVSRVAEQLAVQFDSLDISLQNKILELASICHDSTSKVV